MPVAFVLAAAGEDVAPAVVAAPLSFDEVQDDRAAAARAAASVKERSLRMEVLFRKCMGFSA